MNGPRHELGSMTELFGEREVARATHALDQYLAKHPNKDRPVLYHHTCVETWRQIGDTPMLMPQEGSLLPGIWLTDLEYVSAAMLGLPTGHLLCRGEDKRHSVCISDEFQVKYQVACERAMPWIVTRSLVTGKRRSEILDLIETRESLLSHWWIDMTGDPVEAYLVSAP